MRLICGHECIRIGDQWHIHNMRWIQDYDEVAIIDIIIIIIITITIIIIIIARCHSQLVQHGGTIVVASPYAHSICWFTIH